MLGTAPCKPCSSAQWGLSVHPCFLSGEGAEPDLSLDPRYLRNAQSPHGALSSRGRILMPLDMGIWDSEGCSSPSSREQMDAQGQSQGMGGWCAHISCLISANQVS